MKKFLLIVFCLISVFQLSAVEDTSLLKSDETQKSYERKAVMGFGDIGFMQDSVKVPMRYCEYNEKGEGRCVPWTFSVNYPLDANEKLKAAKIFYQWTITNRFDKIILGDNVAFMRTKGGEVKIDLGGKIPTFRAGTSDRATFRRHLEHYLNSDVRKVFGNLLDASAEQRYSELSEKEQETFMVTKAKELGLSAAFVKNLLNSSYVFAAHVAPIGGAGRVIRSKHKSAVTGLHYYSFDVEIELSVNVVFMIYRYNYETKRFEHYGDIVGHSGGITGSTDTALQIIPTPKQVMSVFNDTFRTAIKAASLNANYQLKQDDNFAIFMPVKSSDGKKIESGFGVMEDIRIDHPFEILETVDGKKQRKGFARAREVSINCNDSAAPTIIKVTNGDAEEGDQLREYPWTGLYFNLGLEDDMVYAKGNRYSGDIGMMLVAPGLHLGTNVDLGYVMNSSALSEFYLNVFLDFNVGLQSEYKDENQKSIGALLYWFGGGLGIAKRFYVGSAGFFFAPAIDASYHGTLNDGRDFQHFDITPQIHLGFSVTPSFDFIIKAGWNVGFLTKAESDEYSGEKVDVSGNYSGFVHGPYMSLDFNFHLPIVSAMARMYKPSSNVCR
ncbi:hypothetical protein II898_01990 [bacterium]|nr:hypothetical protein [bacterium]